MSQNLDPEVTSFALERGDRRGTYHQYSVSKRPSTQPQDYPETRISNLQNDHDILRGELNSLKQRHDELSAIIDRLRKEGSSLLLSPQSPDDLDQSLRAAAELRSNFDMLSREAHGPINEEGSSSTIDRDNTPMLVAVSVESESPVSKSLPPHLRVGKTSKSMNKIRPSDDPKITSSKATNGNVSNGKFVNGKATKGNFNTDPTLIPTMSASPQNANGNEGLEFWRPYYLTQLPALSTEIQSKIPGNDALTFHPDFLHNHLDGLAWSPGLRFIPGPGPCILKNRTYYLLDPQNDPFLPNHPGAHGAKLTPFFNVAPEDKFGQLPDGATSYEYVPMFIKVKDSKGHARYAYYGDYSQTRWSDKVDYCTMMTKVPRHVKEFWAKELTSKTRADWVTTELKRHFFKKSEYEGRLYATVDDDATVTSAEEGVMNGKMEKDIKKYVEELREWDRDANMRVSMIKKDFIMQAFERADADEPPALRLWWEYLQCVDWNEDFFSLLVTLQSRAASRYLV